MKNSKTTLRELTREYRSILRKCFLLNLGIILFATSAQAGEQHIDGDLNISGNYSLVGGNTEETFEERHVEGDVTIDSTAKVNLKNAGIYTSPGEYDFTISGATITMDNAEVAGHNGLDITGGKFNLSHDSEFAGEPYLSISNADVTLNASHLLSRTDWEDKGEITIANTTLTVNKGFIGAFNYSDGGEYGDQLSEGGDITISGNSKITFNGGNSLDAEQDWIDDEKDPAGGRFLANEILAENIYLNDTTTLTVSKGATLKTTSMDYTDSSTIDLGSPASTIHLLDNSVLNISGTLRADISGNQNIWVQEELPDPQDEFFEPEEDFEPQAPVWHPEVATGTLNLLSSTALVGSISNVNVNVLANTTWNYSVNNLNHVVVGKDQKTKAKLTLDANENFFTNFGSLTIKSGSEVYAHTESAEWDEEHPGELDEPSINQFGLNIGDLIVEKNATLNVSANRNQYGEGRHAADMWVLNSAQLFGTVNLTNASIEADDEDGNVAITLDGAKVTMNGTANMETGGLITIKNSNVTANLDDHGFVSGTRLDVDKSDLTLAGAHLIGLAEFDDGNETSGTVNIKNNSKVTLAGEAVIGGKNIVVDNSTLNIKNDNAFLSDNEDIFIQNKSDVTIENGSSLSILANGDFDTLDDLAYPTIWESYEKTQDLSGGTLHIDNSTLTTKGSLLLNTVTEWDWTVATGSIETTNATVNVVADAQDTEAVIQAKDWTVSGKTDLYIAATGRHSDAGVSIDGSLTVTSGSTLNITSPKSSDEGWIEVSDKIDLKEGSTLKSTYGVFDEEVEIYASNFVADKATIDLTSTEIDAYSTNIQNSTIKLNDASLVAHSELQITQDPKLGHKIDMNYSDLSLDREGKNFYKVMDDEDQDEFLDDMQRHIRENDLFGWISTSIQYSHDFKLSNDITLHYDNAQDKIIWIQGNEEKPYNSWEFWPGGELGQRIQAYLEDIYDDEEKLKIVNDSISHGCRMEEGRIELSGVNLTAKYASEITNEISGDVDIFNSSITLNKGKAHTSILSNMGTTGDIFVGDNSTVTLNDNTNIIRGIYRWTNAGLTINPGVETSYGDITFDHSKLIMNGTSFLALSDTNGAIGFQNGATWEVNGKNTVYLKNTVDEADGAGTIGIGFNDEGEHENDMSTLTIAKGASLTLVGGNVGYIDHEEDTTYESAIYTDEHGQIEINGTLTGKVINGGTLNLASTGRFNGDLSNSNTAIIAGTLTGNVENEGVLTLTSTGRINGDLMNGVSELTLAGTLNGVLTTEGILNITKTGKIIGRIEQAPNIHLEGHKADLKAILGSSIKDSEALTLSGAGAKYTLNNAMFSVSNPDDIAYVVSYVDEGKKCKDVYGQADWEAMQNDEDIAEIIPIGNGYQVTRDVEEDEEPGPEDIDIYTYVDNQLGDLTITNGASLTTNQTLYANTVTLDNASFVASNSTGIWTLELDNGSKATFNSNFDQSFGRTVSLDHGSTLELSNGWTYFVVNGENFYSLVDEAHAIEGPNFTLQNNSNLITKNLIDFQGQGIDITDSKWTDSSSFSELDILNVSGASTLNLNNSEVFVGDLNIEKGEVEEGQKKTSPQVTLNNGSILSSFVLRLDDVNVTANNSTLGIQRLYPIENTDFSIYNSTLTLNGNSSLKNSLFCITKGKKTYTDIGPKDLGEYADILGNFGNQIWLSDSTLTLNGTASVINNSIKGGTGNIVMDGTSTLRVNGKNTLTATENITFNEGSTLSIAKGAVLNVNSNYDWEEAAYNHTIDLDGANLELSGTLNGSLTGWANSLTLSSNFKPNEAIAIDWSKLKGMGVSGANAKTLDTIIGQFDGKGIEALDTFSMIDKSNLSLTALTGIINNNITTVNVKNNSTFTINNVPKNDPNEEETPDFQTTNFNVSNSAINVTKNAWVDVGAINMENSSLTVTGNITNASEETQIEADTFEMDNTGKPQTALALTNAIMVVGEDVTLTNANLKIAGNIRNANTTVLSSTGDINILNDANTKAIVNISSANMTAANNHDINIENASVTVVGDAKRNTPNRLLAKDISINNVDNAKATVTMANIKIDANKLNIANTASAKLSNTWSTGDTEFEKVRNLTLSSAFFEGNVSVAGDATTIQNKGTKKEKFVYASNASLSNSSIMDLTNEEQAFDLTADNTLLTIGKNVFVSGTLAVKDTHDDVHEDELEKVNATRVLVKENLTVGAVDLEQGTVEVAAKKTLDSIDGFELGTHSALLLNGIASGIINSEEGPQYGTISILNNAAKINGDVYLSSGELEFKNVKGKFSTFINGAATLGDLKLTNATLTYDSNNNIGGNLNVTNSTLTLAETLDENIVTVGGDFTLAKGSLYLGTKTLDVAGVANIHDKSTIYVNVDNTGNYGSLKADTINLETYTSGKNKGKPTNINLAVTLPREKTNNSSIYSNEKIYQFLAPTYDEEEEKYKISGALNKVTVTNNRYIFEEVEVGQFKIKESFGGRGIITRYTPNVAPGVLAAAAAFVDSGTRFAVAQQEVLADTLDTLSQVVGGEEDYIQALSATNPDDEAIVQTSALTATDTLLDTAASRMTGGLVAGMSAGDVVGNHGAMWGQALYNQTKLDATHKYQGFKGISKGSAVGVEANITDDVKLGLAYAYTQNDIKSSYRKMDVDTHGISLYGEYKPNNWFINAITAFAWSDYDAKAWSTLGTTKSDFDVHTYSAQTTTGYTFDVSEHIQTTPSIGLRYVNLNQEAYKDSDAKQIHSSHNDLVTVIVGNNFKASYASENGIKWTPELRIGMSYDVHSDASESVVGLSNGTSYRVPTRRLKRLGITGGIGGVVNAGAWDFTLGYDVDVRKEYRSHTGSLKAKYHF